MASSRFVVGRAADLAEGDHVIVTVNNRSVGIYNIKGRFYGLLNHCPHRGAELCRGRKFHDISSTGPGDYRYDEAARMLICPWHGWEFDITTGQSYFDPKGTRARPYQVEVESGQAVISDIEAGQTSFTPAEYAAVSSSAISTAGTPGAAGRVPGPYLAETVDIRVEDEYLVVDIRPRRPARAVSPVPAGGIR